eukprot:COSAG04_NODE_44_length_31776_cov_9.320769_2_plen_1968_part_00
MVNGETQGTHDTVRIDWNFDALDFAHGSYEYVDACADACARHGDEVGESYIYFGMEWSQLCMCSPVSWEGSQPAHGCDDAHDCPNVCGAQGERCGRGESEGWEGCGWTSSVYAAAAWRLPTDESDSSSTEGSSCWSTLPHLVPNPHPISELATDRSSQGEAYFAERFCPGWSSYISAACDPDQEACDKDTATLGNAVFDGGDDMYDIGNLIVTSLMGDCESDPHDCALGSLRYHADFEPVPTNCFGRDGHYQMAQHDGMWLFFTTNVDDAPLDFMISGNLGSDGRGTVTEFVFDVPPHTGFVKRECGDTDGDPSVNHMIIVDSSQGRPVHSCDYANGGECTGADSNLDDDIVSGIAPGSHILYLLYSTEAGSCMKEDEHREIFNTATLCIRAADPFSVLNGGQTSAGRVLVEVDVDDAGHILFGGKAPYVGWTRGNPRQVSGPIGFPNALRFDDHSWLQLGDTGVGIAGNWTLDCWVQVDAAALGAMRDEGVLVESTAKDAYISVRRQNGRIELGGAGSTGEWVSSGIGLSDHTGDWVRLTVSSERSVGQFEVRSHFFDGQVVGSVEIDDSMLCDDALCLASFFVIGNRADGTAPFPLPLHRLRVVEGALRLGDVDAYGMQPGDLLRYQPENSRSIKLSRGTDALEVTWDTFGWDTTAHDHVHVSLDSTGGVRLRCDNMSLLWDRAVASASGVTGDRSAISNWTSEALSSDAGTGLFVRYIDSDPCFDLWPGTTCSLSDWPVGTDDCAEQLDCEALSWPPDEHGSPDVCGSSSLVGQFGSSDMCVRERTYEEAASLCTDMGGRLCTADELDQGEGDPESCDYDSIFKWSWVDTPLGTCPSSNQSLGMSGGAGAWFSFVPSESTVHEVQVRTDEVTHQSSLSILGVLDAYTEMAPGGAATLHRREGGIALRWNSTQIRGRSFVHVKSSADEARYTMAVVTPPVYTWHNVPSRTLQVSGSAVRRGLVLQNDGTVAVELPFGFPFLGMEHRRMWVSSFGMVLFEQPRQQTSYLDHVYSAIVAAAGNFDLSRVGASVTTAQPTPTEIQIAWHAPLFRSTGFSDVMISMAADGSVTIDWQRIDLSQAGSLQHRLAASLQFETQLRDASMQDATAIFNSVRFSAVQYTGQMSYMSRGEAVSNTTVGAFFGADPGEGLDFEGNFLAAVTLQTLDTTLRVGDALFTGIRTTGGHRTHGLSSVPTGTQLPAWASRVPRSDSDFPWPRQPVVEGCDPIQDGAGNVRSVEDLWKYGRRCTYQPDGYPAVAVTFDGLWPSNGRPALGHSPDDEELIKVLYSQQWSIERTTIELGELGVGERYRVQLLFAHVDGSCFNHGFDFYVDGVLEFKDFSVQDLKGGCRPTESLVGDFEGEVVDAGVFLRHDFTARQASALLTLDSSDLSQDRGFSVWYGHNTPILCGFTLERIEDKPQGDFSHASALRLVDDAYLQLPEMVLGGSAAVTAWVSVGTLWDSRGVGVTLFNSFESDTCGNSDVCRNAVHGDDGLGGWFSVGNDVLHKRPADLWSAGTTFDLDTAELFWEGARDEWMMVTVSIAGHAASIYDSGSLRGVGTLASQLPRMLRHNNYVGASHHAPFQRKSSGVTLGISDFRLYDRSLSADEVSALFIDPSSECCVSAGLQDAFGVDNLDLTAELMGAQPSAVVIAPSATGVSREGTRAHGCQASASPRKLDICGEVTSVSDCRGTISDGVGPYANSIDCGLRLTSFVGSTYTLTFDEFLTEQDVDLLSVYDGGSSEAPLLGQFSGKTVPAPITSSGRSMYLRFAANDNSVAVGFIVSFSCAGTPVEYWKPADVATPLTIGAPPVNHTRRQTECLSDVLLSVQCCADAKKSCATARVTEMGLSGSSLRGFVPSEIGNMGALRSLKLSTKPRPSEYAETGSNSCMLSDDNFLTGTLPFALGRLHLLRELQMSHNQFDMQDRETLSAILGGMMHLRTLDIGMSKSMPHHTKCCLNNCLKPVE